MELHVGEAINRDAPIDNGGKTVNATKEGEEIVVRATTEEMRLLGATLNEALDGAYAIPSDEWEELVGPRASVRRLMKEIVDAIAR